MDPLIGGLVAKGLGILADAVMSKGRAVVEEKLGVKLPDDIRKVTDEELMMYKRLENEHERWLIDAALDDKRMELEADARGAANVTERWKSDMLSDSWLSKNIRPLALIYLTAAFTLLIVIDGFVESFAPDQVYLTLLAELLKMVYTAYFVGRSIEKSMEIYHGWKTRQSSKETSGEPRR